MEDFNILNLDGQVMRKEELRLKSQLYTSNDDWKGDFWRFIAQWINHNNFIEVSTSGSTGIPRSIKISKKKMLVSAAMTCTYFQLKENDKALLCLSTKHIGGIMMIVRAFFAKLNLYIVEPQANPVKKLNEQFDFTAMVPYQAQTCINESIDKVKNIKNIIIGGGGISTHLEKQIIVNKINAYSTFGMTETISHFALKKIGKGDFYTCLDNIEIEKSVDDTLIINAPNLLEEKLFTNDIIELKNNKQFIWLGRKDFAIETGGVKIIPEVVEKKLMPYISSRFIISSLPSIKFNSEVILIIEGSKYNIEKSMFQVLSKYEKPKTIYFVKEFTETANGKIEREATKKRIISTN